MTVNWSMQLGDRSLMLQSDGGLMT